MRKRNVDCINYIFSVSVCLSRASIYLRVSRKEVVKLTEQPYLKVELINRSINPEDGASPPEEGAPPPEDPHLKTVLPS